MQYETRELTFGSYRGRVSRMLTHTVAMTTPTDYGTPLCKRIAPDAVVDHFGMDEAGRNAPPTCETCYRRDPRFGRAATPARTP